jgi:thymidine kinase
MNNLYSSKLELICGPMFSGKTEELIRRVRRAQIARQKVQIFKPKLDTRYSEEKVVSHSALEIQAEPVSSAVEIFSLLKDSTRIIAIDEVQFFDIEVVAIASKLARRGYRVICAGLDLDYLGRPFGPMPYLLAIADDVTKVQAICTICGSPASKSQRIVLDQDKVLLGAKESYEARCNNHYEIDETKDAISFGNNQYQIETQLSVNKNVEDSSHNNHN